MRITKGVSLGELIDMVNTIPKEKKKQKGLGKHLN